MKCEKDMNSSRITETPIDMTHPREQMIRTYFQSWVVKSAQLFENIFASDCLYIESNGTTFRSIQEILRWFDDWNRVGTVLQWNILRFVHGKTDVAVEWYFQCDYEGVTAEFDGVSLIDFNELGFIIKLREYATTEN